MSTFIVRPDGLSSITCNLWGSSPGSNYVIAEDAIDMNESKRIKIVYAEGESGGFVRKTTQGLVPIKFVVAVFGSSQADAMANFRILVQACTNSDGGLVEYVPAGLDGSTMSTYYHYLQSAPPRIRPGGLVEIKMERFAQKDIAFNSPAVICEVELMTRAWATSDPSSYSTVVSPTAINNEGTSLVVPASSIKGDAVQAVLEVNGTMTGSDDILKNTIVYRRPMRVGANTDLDWIEGEDMGDPSSSYSYRMFVGIHWRSSIAYNSYPTDILANSLDGASLVTATKVQSDGRDFRVFLDGIERDRWLQDFNTATSQCWVNLDFAADISMTLNGNISDSATAVVVNESTAGMPSAGVIQIDSEFMHYSSLSGSTFTIGTRGYGNTAEASHTSGATVKWIQHDLWVYYGAAVSAPSTDDNYKPIFELSSTNVSWIYQEFGTAAATRPGSWQYIASAGSPVKYTANRNTNSDPWEEVGIVADANEDRGFFGIASPCRITNVNFSNGEKWSDIVANYSGYVVGGSDPTMNLASYDWEAISSEYVIPDPSAPSTWESWSYSGAVSGTKYWIFLACYGLSTTESRAECADVTITLNGTYGPDIVFGTEEGAVWTTVPDSEASGNNYARISTSSAYLAISSTNTAGMDSTYLGKIVPIVIARCDPGTIYTLQFVTYVTNRVAAWQTSGIITLSGTSYFRCIYGFGEIDFPPFTVPEWVSEANIDDYIDTVYIELQVTRTYGAGGLDVDVVCLARADDFITHVYNAVDATGLQESTDDVLVVDSVENITHTKDSSDYVRQYWERQGAPLSSFVLPATHDHRIRVIGFVDTDTLKYTPTYTFSATLKGLHLTIYPFETS